MVDQAYSLRELMRDKKVGVQEKSADMVAIASGKGGVGKSLFTANLAIALHRRGQRVLVIDADFGLSNLDILMGVTPKYNLSHVIHGECTMEEAIVHCRSGIMIISGGSGMEELLHLEEKALSALMNAFMRFADQVDIILFDMGAGVSDRVIQVVTACARAIVMTTPEPTAVLDAYALVKTVMGENNRPRLHLVVNRAASLKEGRTTLENFVEVTRKYIGAEVHPLGIIPYDDAAPHAIKTQTPLLEAHPKSPASMAIERIADALMGKSASQDQLGGIAGFFVRLLQGNSRPRHMEG